MSDNIIKKKCLPGLDTADYTEYKIQDIGNAIDPENNLFHNFDNSCDYYTDEEFNFKMTTAQTFSIIHFSSKSLYANFINIKEYLKQFHQQFSIIAISETWIKSEKGADFEINGYELNFKSRANKNGGGVAVYVDNKLQYKIVESMTVVVDDICECITIEIFRENMKNIFVTCIY